LSTLSDSLSRRTIAFEARKLPVRLSPRALADWWRRGDVVHASRPAPLEREREERGECGSGASGSVHVAVRARGGRERRVKGAVHRLAVARELRFARVDSDDVAHGFQ
jgi:hypothetical protein